MTVRPSPYDILRAIQDQQAVLQASIRATDRLVLMLAGMLDKSAPDPIMASLSSAVVEPEPKADFDETPAPKPKRDRRKTGESARPAVFVTYGDVEIKTTERRALLLNTLRKKPMTLTELARAQVAPTVDGVKAQVIDLNRDLAKAGVALKVESIPGKQRIGAKGGREPSYYRLVEPVKKAIAPPERQPSAQSEGEAGECPEQGSAERTAGGGDIFTAHADQFVTSSGAGAELPGSADPVPAADEPPPTIEKLAAVDGDRVFGPGGMTYVRDTAARALDILKHGDMFGLDMVAKRAKCPSAEVVRQALNIERSNLAQIGLDLYLDKFNVRLRGIE